MAGLEDALRDSEDRFRLLSEAVIDHALVSLAPNGQVQVWNAGAERLTGFRDADVVGRHVDILYPVGAKDEPARTMESAVRDGRCGAAGWRIRRSGERYWASMVYTARRDPAGRLLGFALVIRDLSAARAAELDRDRLLRAEQAARAEAARARQAKSNFVAMMSAEFRTPLNTIRGYAELLAMGLHGELTVEQQADLTRIQRAEHQLTRLVTELGDYISMETGTVEIDTAAVEVTPLLEDLIEEYDAALASKQISYDVSAPASLTLWADRVRLDQILGHMLESAIRFTPSGGHVFVAAARRGSVVALTVQDSGEPPSPGRRASLLHPFDAAASAGSAREREDEAPGLGLALSRTLAVAMGGNLFIENADAGGARFVLFLPGTPAGA
ncbi:MAG: PAS domain-containing sensor histidine kinase [Gemmatimonadaceae bacterium]